MATLTSPRYSLCPILVGEGEAVEEGEEGAEVLEAEGLERKPRQA